MISQRQSSLTPLMTMSTMTTTTMKITVNIKLTMIITRKQAYLRRHGNP
jgi:hypothetical protein